jgi:hypothetical protein
LLLLYPSLQRAEKGCHHVEIILLDQIVARALLHLVLALEGGQIGELVPVDFLFPLASSPSSQVQVSTNRNLFARARLKVRVHGHGPEDV